MRGTLRAFLLALVLGVVLGAKGTLKIAACVPGFAPFILTNNQGNVVGYEVDQWKELHKYAYQRAVDAGDQALMELFGDEPSDVIQLSWTETMAALDDRSIDAGMCGFYVNADRTTKWDFLPTYLATGMRAMVKREPPDLSTGKVLTIAAGKPDAWAIFALMMVLVIGVIFAHLIWILERKDNIDISVEYGPGIFDSMYLALGIAATITFGDKKPVTYAGKILTWVWMFTGTFFVAMFVAAITSTILANKLGVSSTAIEIQKPADLVNYKIGTSFNIASDAAKNAAPGVFVKQYDTQWGSLDGLMAGEVDVVVDDAWTNQYVSNRADGYMGRTIPMGLIFHKLDVGVAMSRPNDSEHPGLATLSRAMVDYMRGNGRRDHEVNLLTWFGEEIVESDLSAADNRALERELGKLNRGIIGGLAGLVFVWAVSVLFHYRKQIETARRKAGLRRAMGLGMKYTKHEVREGAEYLFECFVTGHKPTGHIQSFKHDGGFGKSAFFGKSFGKSMGRLTSSVPGTRGHGDIERAQSAGGDARILSLSSMQEKLQELGTEIDLKDLCRIAEQIVSTAKEAERETDASVSVKPSLIKELSNANPIESRRRKSSINPMAMSVNKAEFCKIIERLVQKDQEEHEKDVYQPALKHHIMDQTEEVRVMLQAEHKRLKKQLRIMREDIANLASGAPTTLSRSQSEDSILNAKPLYEKPNERNDVFLPAPSAPKAVEPGELVLVPREGGHDDDFLEAETAWG